MGVKRELKSTGLQREIARLEVVRRGRSRVLGL